MKDAGNDNSPEQPSTPMQKKDDALELCATLIQDFKVRADRHKRIFKRLSYSSIFLAILVTVVAALTATQGAYLWVVPILSGLSAFCTTLLSATNSQERWIQSRVVEQQLEAERFLYLQQAGKYTSSDEVATARFFSERVVEIWSEAQQRWVVSVGKVSHEPPLQK